MATKAELNAIRDRDPKKKKIGKRIYDRDKLIAEMLEWSEDETAINFCSFCAEGGYLPSLIWRLENEDQDFADAYTICRMRLAARREALLNAEQMHCAAFTYYQRSYDPFLDKHKHEQADKDADRRQRQAEKNNINLAHIAKTMASSDVSNLKQE